MDQGAGGLVGWEPELRRGMRKASQVPSTLVLVPAASGLSIQVNTWAFETAFVCVCVCFMLEKHTLLCLKGEDLPKQLAFV